MPILDSSIPFQVTEKCSEEVELNCDGSSGNKDPSTSYEVVFPNSSKTALPLSGGAIVKLDFSALPTEVNDVAVSLLEAKVSSLMENTFKNSIVGLVDARLIVNSIISDVGKSGALKNFPSVTIASLAGDDSSLDHQKSDSSISKICSIKYIPVQVLEALGSAFLALEDSDAFGTSENPLYGITGRKFSDYAALNNEEITIEACLDLLPFYNISEKNIIRKRGITPTGGYYTVVDDNAYIKFPDLTGRDSGGFSPDLWSEEEERNLYIEVLNKAKLTRITISEILAPPSATVVDYNGEFPDTGSLKIELDTDSDIDEAYLSLIINSATMPKIKGVKEYSNGIELSTIPMLTKPVLVGVGDGTHRTFEYETDGFDVATLKSFYDDESDDDQIMASGVLGEYGKLSTDTTPEIPLNYIYGEQNRPEIALANREKDKPNRRNNRKYKNSKMSSARPLFAQVRPRLYDEVPKTWIKGSISTSGGVTFAEFRSSDLSVINRANGTGVSNFALYLKSKQQIVRVPGANISLGTAVPSIKSITPHGFRGGGIIGEETLIRISGENLGNTNEIILRGSNGSLNFNKVIWPNMIIDSTASSVIVAFKADAFNTIFSNARYELSVSTSDGVKSNNEMPIYISSKSNAIPYPNNLLANFASNEFTADYSESPSGIPLLSDGQSAEIKIRSKSKLFNGNYPIFAYFALPHTFKNVDIMNEFEMDVRTIGSEALIIASKMEWELKPSLLEDFAPRTRKKAVIKFPGSNFTERNLSKLAGLNDASIVFLNDSLENLVGSENNISLTSQELSVVKLGGATADDGESPSPAFINPGHITAIIAEVPGGNVLSNVSNIEEKVISDGQTVGDLFDNKTISPGSISVYQTIPKLAIIFSGTEMPFMRKRHDFLLGGKSIKDKLNDSIISLDNGKENIAIFRNVTSKEEGDLGFGIKVKDKRYNVTYDSSTVYGTITGDVISSGFSIDGKTEDLTLSSQIPTAEVSSFVNQPASDDTTLTAFSNLIGSTGNGVIISNPSSLTDFEPFTPISILSKQGDITLNATSLGDTEYSATKIIANSTENDVRSIQATSIIIPSGSPYSKKQYMLNDDGSRALVFNRIGISNGAAVRFNVPEIISMSTNRAGLALKKIPSELPVNAGDKVYIRVKNVKRNFSIKIGTAVVKAVSPRKVSRGEYDAQFVVPSSLIGSITSDDCMVICASGVNADRLKAKRILGNTFVIDLEQKMQDLLFGKLKDKIPDIDDLKDLLCKVPLRFMSVDLCNPNIPTELINSFCDLSFSLLADLKLALNGFQVLMIPIQVIFCIIDVLCALLNPIKTAKAMIRLFECLFDLVLLLPQISVPVMFFKLILHLLKLLECVIDKILGIIKAVNAIVPAMQAALKNKDWASLKALEEVLSEYLFDLNVDLDILAPVISILAIFLQLLQLVFRFPCQVTPADNAGACSIDGTMLAGIVGGVVSPENAIVPDHLIPVAQVYTSDTIEEALANGTSTLIDPSSGDVIAERDPVDNLYITNMEIDEDTLRAKNSSLDFKASMAVSVTKSRKGFRNPAEVEFLFKGKYEPGVFIKSKILDPAQSADSVLQLMEETASGEMKISSGKGNFVSPIDGLTFMTKSNGFGSIKTLEQKIELPILEVNEDTAALEEVGVETVWKTFDGIPMLTILDEEFNLYFIREDGIEFDDDDNVSSIKATMVNNVAAPKLKFSKEDTEVDINDDDVIDEDDEEAKVYDFPQIYFVDMRSCIDTINSFCNGASLNSFLLEEDNSDAVADIIEGSKECLEDFIGVVKGFGSSMRDSLNEGVIPGIIDVGTFDSSVLTLQECLNDAADKMCIYVVNTLTTTFKVEEDAIFEKSNQYFVPGIGSEDLESLGFEENQPSITGATEYSDGEGDTAILGLGEEANIVVTPRDAMDLPVGGELVEKIILEIVSDTTGDAEIIRNDDNSIFTQIGNDYKAKVVSNKEGEVKLRVRVCNRTIQAVTYDGLVSAADSGGDEGCIDDTGVDSGSSEASGNLIKVDRIISIFYTRKSVVKLGTDEDQGALAQSTPQAFGTSLEN